MCVHLNVKNNKMLLSGIEYLTGAVIKFLCPVCRFTLL